MELLSFTTPSMSQNQFNDDQRTSQMVSESHRPPRKIYYNVCWLFEDCMGVLPTNDIVWVKFGRQNRVEWRSSK